MLKQSCSRYAIRHTFGSNSARPHLLNLTAYDRVLWLGLDTMPLQRFADDAAWQCNASAVVQVRSSSICIEYNGNVDTMLLTPNPQKLEQIVMTSQGTATNGTEPLGTITST